ncbi:hypothetical protein CMV_021646 [Castanea mollissima]|uniref:Uncharacterized protein n=1 Tax=Castanea mollissima TaxID=60419 RepID=A0A8J4QXS6_9ROSI|nr:hypothetical protein CMV_021646 [Castanea mollissima]
MGRSMHKFSYFSPPYSGEEKMLLQLDLAGKGAYLLTVIVLLLLYIQKCKRNRRGGRHVRTTNRVNVVRGDNGGETIRGQIIPRVRADVAGGEVGDTTGGQYAGKVHFNVAGDDDGDSHNLSHYRFPRSQLGIPILSHDIENLSEIGAKRFSVKPWLWRVSILCTRLKADNPLYGSSHIDYILHAVKTEKFVQDTHQCGIHLCES